MRSSEVDLLLLSDKMDAHKSLCNDELDVIDRIIWSYNLKSPLSYNIIMVLGNPTCVEFRLPDAIIALPKNIAYS